MDHPGLKAGGSGVTWTVSVVIQIHRAVCPHGHWRLGRYATGMFIVLRASLSAPWPLLAWAAFGRPGTACRQAAGKRGGAAPRIWLVVEAPHGRPSDPTSAPMWGVCPGQVMTFLTYRALLRSSCSLGGDWRWLSRQPSPGSCSWLHIVPICQIRAPWGGLPGLGPRSLAALACSRRPRARPANWVV